MCAPLTTYLRSTVLFTLLLCTLNVYYTVLILLNKIQLNSILPISSFLRTCPYHLSLASRVFSPNRPTCAVPLMYSFLILSILVSPSVTSSTLPPSFPPPVFSSVPPSPTRTTLLVLLPPYNLPFHSSGYSPVADHYWHSSLTIPSCPYSLLHFTSALSITLYSWSQLC